MRYIAKEAAKQLEKEQFNSLSPEAKLKSFVDDYAYNKDKENHYKKIATDLNNKIKKSMQELNLEVFETDDNEVKLTEIVKKSFNEDVLINILKEMNEKSGLELDEGLILTQEYVNMGELERLIYNEKINAAELLPAQEEKVTSRLTYKSNRKV